MHRELGTSRPIGGVARRWRRRPILAVALSLCLVHAIHRELGADFVVGEEGRPMRRQAARPMHAAPGTASLCVCLHHRSVTCSFQTATTCDPSGAREQSSHRRGGKAMAAAAYPGTSLPPVLGGTCDTPSRTPSCACRCVRLHHRAVVCSVQPATACDLSLFAFHAAGLRRGI